MDNSRTHKTELPAWLTAAAEIVRKNVENDLHEHAIQDHHEKAPTEVEGRRAHEGRVLLHTDHPEKAYQKYLSYHFQPGGEGFDDHHISIAEHVPDSQDRIVQFSVDDRAGTFTIAGGGHAAQIQVDPSGKITSLGLEMPDMFHAAATLLASEGIRNNLTKEIVHAAEWLFDSGSKGFGGLFGGGGGLGGALGGLFGGGGMPVNLPGNLLEKTKILNHIPGVGDTLQKGLQTWNGAVNPVLQGVAAARFGAGSQTWGGAGGNQPSYAGTQGGPPPLPTQQPQEPTWWVQGGGGQAYGLAGIRAGVQQGAVTRSTLVCSTTAQQWVEAGSVPELASLWQ